MTKLDIDDIVKTVCEGTYRCPVFDAYNANGDAEEHCFERDECPLRHSLELYQRYKMAEKASDSMKAKPSECEKTIPVPKEESLGGVQLWENGPYWAECNLGATKPEEYGHYFKWGYTTGNVRNEKNDGWVPAKDETPFDFSEEICATYGRSPDELKKMGCLDGKGNLVSERDAATAYLGAPWRMPTKEDFDNLVSKCDSELTTRNGVFGRLVTGRGAFASKRIFLPAAGYGNGSRLYYPGSGGYYWSSTPDSDDSNYAWGLYFVGRGYYDRCLWQPVRPLRGFAK